jgi:hypothetical protein
VFYVSRVHFIIYFFCLWRKDTKGVGMHSPLRTHECDEMSVVTFSQV